MPQNAQRTVPAEPSPREADLAATSHGLRAPMATLSVVIGMLRDGDGGQLTDKGRELIDLAQQSCSRMIRTLEDYLELESIQSGEGGQRRRRVEISRAVQDAIDSTRFNDEFAAAVFEMIHEVPGPSIACDPARLARAVGGLLANAAKFSPPTEKIRVEVRREGSAVRVIVADRGPGVPADLRERVFARFYHGHSPDGARKGAGLGLSIAKAVAESLGGRAGCEETPGGGATFYLELPAEG